MLDWLFSGEELDFDMLPAKQKELLLSVIQDGPIAISNLRLPAATVYKYLSRLESLRVRNTRGVLELVCEADLEPRSSIARRRRINKSLKAGVARYIVARLAKRQGQGASCGPIFLDCGSACAEIGREIVEQRSPNCPVVTINPLVFQAFASAPDFNNLHVLRGEVDWNKGSILTSVREIQEAVFDTAIIGTDLVFSNATLGQVTATGIELKQAAMKKAREVFFPVDRSKLRAQPSTDDPLLFKFDRTKGCVVVGVDQTVSPETVADLKKLTQSAAGTGLEVVIVFPSGRALDLAAVE